MIGPHLERLSAVAAAFDKRHIAIAGYRDLRDAPEALTPGVSASMHVYELGKTAKPTYEGKLGSTAAHALSFTRDNHVLVGTADGRVLLFDPGADSDAPARELSLGSPVLAIAVAPSGKLAAAADKSGAVHLLELPGLRATARRALSLGPLNAVAFDAEGARVLAGGADAVVYALPVDGSSDAAVREMPLGSEAVTALAVTDDGRIVAGVADGRILLAYLEGAVDVEDRSSGVPHDTAVRGLVALPPGQDEAGRELPRRLLSTSEDGALRSWELDSRRRPKTVMVAKGARAAALAPPSRSASDAAKAGTLAVVSEDRTLSLLHVDAAGQTTAWLTVSSGFSQHGEDLRAKADKVREAAIASLSTLPEDEARQLLEGALAADRQPKLRALAAASLGEGMRRLARPALRAALDDVSPEPRAAAFAALRRIEEGSPLSAVRAALSSSYADVRQAAVALLPSLRAASPLVPGLIAGALNDAEADVRRAAFAALFALHEASSLEPVAIAMRHGPVDIRVSALVRVAPLSVSSESARDLIERAHDDPDEAVRSMATTVALLSRPPLAARLASLSKPIRKWLADVAEKTPVSVPEDPGGPLSDEDKQPLFAMLAARSPDSALRGAEALGLLQDRRATGALLSLSREPDASFRDKTIAAIEATAYRLPGDARLTARLEWLLDDPDERVRSHAFAALSRLHKPDGAKGELALCALALSCKSPDVRLRALPLLTAFGGTGRHAGLDTLPERADGLLGDALDDEDEKVRTEAFRTLFSWHAEAPEEPLRRAAGSRHPDVRERAAVELKRVAAAWADELLITLASDTSSQVGRRAFDVFVDKSEEHAKDARIYVATLRSTRPDVCVMGARKAPPSTREETLPLLLGLIEDERLSVAIAAIEAVDRLKPTDLTAFQRAFASPYLDLRVRAAELCGKRRDERAIEPTEKILSIPASDLRYPPPPIRQRATAALADVGAPKTLDFLVALLEDGDPLVNEHAARGLATATRPGQERGLLDALTHNHLAVRSWAAEGLARLGDARAIPVLAGSLAHDHRPLRLGAIMGYVALGEDGVRGILAGLDDHDTELQELSFAVVVARDLALRRAGVAPDLLLSVLGSASPEIRFAAARLLESREDPSQMEKVATELVGPKVPERASDIKDWPDEDRRSASIRVVVDALASEHPAQRYAATQVLALRNKPKAFFREAARITGPALSSNLRIPHTNWEAEPKQPRAKGWIHALFRRPRRAPAQPGTERVLEVLSFVGGATPGALPEADDGGFAEHRRLAFGTYVGLVRQAPNPGDADLTHRVRRDSIGRLAALAEADDVGRDVVLPVLRKALDDPSHLVRRAALTALRGLYPDGALVPLALMLKSSAADVGKAAVDALIEAASSDAEAAALARSAVDAPVAEVRKHALSLLPRLYESGSAEPFILALASTYADVRLAVVDRLVDSTDDRVKLALTRAMESSHEDLRLKAAAALAVRGDDQTVDVLAGLLRSERPHVVSRALEALVALAHARPTEQGTARPTEQGTAAEKAASALAGRIEDDPDRTADRGALIRALQRVGHDAGIPTLLAAMAAGGDEVGKQLVGGDENRNVRDLAFTAMLGIALTKEPAQRLPDGTTRARYREPALLGWLGAVVSSPHEALRLRVAQTLRDVDSEGAEELLVALLKDRSEAVRAAACEALAFRVEHVESAGLDSLAATLREARRELVLPAAIGLAIRQRPEAFQALLLVLKAGQQAERTRAVLALGSLGDPRALEELRAFVDPAAELEPEDRALGPSVARAFGRLLRRLAEGTPERDEVQRTLEQLATESAGPLRDAALTGLREAGDERSLALLERTAADALEPFLLRRHAINELAIAGAESSEGVLAELLDDPQAAGAAFAALQRIFPADRTRTSLHALRSANPGIAGQGAAYLTKHGEAETLAVSLAQIELAPIRETLRRGLIRRGACPVGALTQLLAAEQPGPRADAAWICAARPAEAEALGDAIAAATERTLRERQDPASDRSAIDEVLAACLFAATELRAPALDTARAVLAEREVSALARREGVRHLAALGEPEDERRLLDAVLDPDASVRSAAAEGLAKSEAAAHLVGEGLVDGAAVSTVVAEMVARNDDALYRSVRSRQLALPTLLRRGKDAQLLLRAQASGAGPDRLAAIDALGRLGSESARAALSSLAADGDEDEVRAAAFRSLRRLERRADRLDRGHAS